MRKKRILIHSNHSKLLTGFGKHCRNLLKYLYSTGKYEVVEFANGYQWDHPELRSVPWEIHGSLPSDPKIHALAKEDPALAQNMSYGSEVIDQAIKTLKPDIYLGIEDLWAFQSFVNRPWWRKISSIIHTTIDSLPLLKYTGEMATRTPNFFVWASFAERELHRTGFKNAKTIRGIVETKDFSRLSNVERQNLRSKHLIGLNDYIIGFVFRNQLRKSVPNLLDGFKLFLERNPNSKAKLLLHTNWKEGWDINSLIEEKKINKDSILTSYVCGKCNNYYVRPFCGHDVNCGICGSAKSVNTPNIQVGFSEKQLNEIYNLMDVYCHPFTSGGQEIPIQEAKLCELITLVTNYSCGEDHCTEDVGGLPLEWAEYREPGSQFIKASTLPISICSQLEAVFKMPEHKKFAMGRAGRKFVIDNFSTEAVGKQFENLFDSLPFCDWDYKFNEEENNPDFIPDPKLDDESWVISLYSGMLKDYIDSTNGAVKHWCDIIKGSSREAVIDQFKNHARKRNIELQRARTFDQISEEDKNKKIAILVPEFDQEVIIATSLVESLKTLHPDHSIYFFTRPEYFDYVDGNSNIKKVLEYHPQLEDVLLLEGRGSEKGYFDMVYSPCRGVHPNNNIFTKNNCDKIEYNVHE